MDIKELSDFIDSIIPKLEAGKGVLSDKERILFQTIKINEEVGELSEQILGKYGICRAEKKGKYNDDNLSLELIDVILATLTLARRLNINIEEILLKKIEIIKGRFEN